MLRGSLEELLGGEYPARPDSMHAGLWLDKFLPGDKFGGEAKSAHIRKLEKQPVPRAYLDAYKMRAASLVAAACRNAGLVLHARALGRLVIGLGAKGVLEAGLRVEPTWGVPILPGTALKGLAAAAAHYLVGGGDWAKPQGWPRSAASSPPSSFEHLFGTRDSAGLVCFHDAWWVPFDSCLPFAPDVMTVHHGDYYQKDNPPAPTDFDTPVPVAFMTVTGRYLVALEGEEHWCRSAEKLLEMGLRLLGIGAKTSSGYGRMSLEEPFASESREADGIPRRQVGQRMSALMPLGEFPEARSTITGTIDRWETEDAQMHEQACRSRQAQKEFHERYCSRLAPVLSPAPTPADKDTPPPAPKADWIPAEGWVEEDRQKRPVLCILLEGKQVDRKAKDVLVGDGPTSLSEDKKLLAMLRAATREAPCAVNVKLDEKKLRAVRSAALAAD
jgi:CRISPR-associated protein Cmr6